ncbi:MAG TPA: sodium:proton antiporter [Nannocystis sp.]
MPFTAWYPALGALFIVMALAGSAVKRLPISPAMLYLAAGLLLGPRVAGLVDLDLADDAMLLGRLGEVAVLVSLFTTGLKLRVPLRDRLWRAPIRLASVSMIFTVAAVALVGMLLLGLSAGAAVMLGAVLAPTDPVLASDVQVEDPRDTETVRFGLTGEAGLNDGSALPFLMLGLGMLGLHELGAWGWRWLAVDVVWSIGAGLGVGVLCGAAVARLVLYLRRHHQEALGLDEFLALGLIALSYGLAHLIHSYGFLAVFAAGVALGRTESESSDAPPPAVDAAAHASDAEVDEPASEPMTQAVLTFNEQFERIAEVALVLCVGAMLPQVSWPEHGATFLAVLLLVIRPLAVWLGLRGAGLSGVQVAFMSWFGVRGIGSLYYVAFALVLGFSGGEAQLLVDLALIVIATSIVLHGISVTPLMRRYRKTPECSDPA